MGMDTLWAPWRLAYVTGEAPADPAPPEPAAWPAGADRGCFLCRAAACGPEHDRRLGVVERTGGSIVVVNRYPYSNGHLLVAPLAHTPSLVGLEAERLLDLQRCLARWCRLMERALHAHGFNIGLNLGAVAGAGLPGHLHWHLVPRWPGDVNFMPMLAGVRVLPQSLEALREQLVAAAAGEPLP
jgi:ATP adenylyltransferase